MMCLRILSVKSIGDVNSDGKRSGVWETRERFGKRRLVSVANYINGHKHGDQFCYAFGELVAVVGYKDGVKHGRESLIYENRRVSELFYYDGKEVS